MRPLVLAVHGSPLPGADGTLRRLGDQVERIAGVRPVVGHLDHQSLSLADVLREGAVVVPLLLGDGYHRTVDIPAVVHGSGCVLTRSLSGEPDVALALRDRLRDAGLRAGVRTGPGSRSAARLLSGCRTEARAAVCRTEGRTEAREEAVVLAGAGSSRPGGNDGALIAADRLRSLLPGIPVRTAYCSATGPTVPDAVAALRATGRRRVFVATFLLAPGRFTAALAEAGADAVAEPLADHWRVARLVARRYEGAARYEGAGRYEGVGAGLGSGRKTTPASP